MAEVQAEDFTPPWRSDKQDAPNRKWRRISLVGDVAGTIVWCFGLSKVFFFDFDVFIANKLGSPWNHFVQFRWLVALLAVAVILVATKKSVFVLLYVIFFPLIIMFWKIPRLLMWFRSWNLLLALSTLCISVFSHFRWRFFIRAFEILVVVTAIASDSPRVAAVCAMLLSLALVYHYVQTIVGGVRASKFLGYQQKFVRTVTSRSRIEPLQIGDELRSDEVERFNKEQLTKFTNSITIGLFTLKLMAFYSDLLQQYRRSYALIFLNVLSYIWLLLQSIILLTMINRSVYIAAPGQYEVSGSSSIVGFLFYSVTSLYGNTIAQIVAVGDIALSIATAAAVYGPIFVLTLGAQLVMTFRQSKDDAAFGDLIKFVKSRQTRLAELLEADYEVTPDEAVQRLRDLGLGAQLFFAYLASKIPDDIGTVGPPRPSS
ncbi:hypothetical protein [Mycobacterium sp. DL99]|uniref:hypothetical protein n=1 Tax=Mycobacterium sp. DL99 TaxID=2528957 RepID=UPI00108150A5|nr:hypothetical protein [Mycobacterium sp. DL99]